MDWSQLAIDSTGIMPAKNICGTIISGINWIIWNSDEANVDSKIPRDKATKAVIRFINIISYQQSQKETTSWASIS